MVAISVYTREETVSLVSLIKMTHFIARRAMIAAIVALLVGPAWSGAAEVAFESGPAPVALIELYTSEGCSSCPPAEKWMAERREDPGLWRDFVPVAFHVNYWDYLGWRDVLATKAFTEREHAYAAAWRADSVYTPCFVRDGAEWRPQGSRAGANDRAKRPAEAGILRVSARGNDRWRIVFTPAGGMGRANANGYAAFVVLLGGGIVSAVRAGENRGRELRHEFVALRLESAPLAAEAAEKDVWSAEVQLAPRPDLKPTRLAVAAWVARKGELAPVQAVGGWLP